MSAVGHARKNPSTYRLGLNPPGSHPLSKHRSFPLKHLAYSFHITKSRATIRQDIPRSLRLFADGKQTTAKTSMPQAIVQFVKYKGARKILNASRSRRPRLHSAAVFNLMFVAIFQ